MKKHIVAFMIFFFHYGLGQTPADDPTWQMVFNEDFNTLDPNIWRTQHHFDLFGAYQAVMLSSNVSIQSSNLVLTLKRETNYNQCPTQFSWQCNVPSYDFSGGWVNSVNENFHYGFYEIRAKMDFRPGFFPAMWMLNSEIKPHYSEIDICEIVGSSPVQQSSIPNQLMTKNIITTNIHGQGSPNPAVINGGQEDYKEIAINDYTQYHIYGFDWQPNRMSWYIDGVLVRTTYPFEPFDVSMTVIFDVHVVPSIATTFYGGSNPYTPDYPAKMYIDYFKYYQLKGNCSPAVSVCNYNFASHTNTTKQSYDIGGIGCSDIVPSNQYYVYRASSHVELKDGFEVPIGSSFLADANPYCNQKTYSTGKCGFVFNPCNYTFSGYINDVKQLIEISGNNCGATVQPTDNVQLHAVEYIRLQEGFSVPLGSEIEIKTMLCPP